MCGKVLNMRHLKSDDSLVVKLHTAHQIDIIKSRKLRMQLVLSQEQELVRYSHHHKIG